MSTTQQEANVAATASVGMLAVCEHMVDHRLPAALSINKPAYGEREVPVLLYHADVAAWLRTVEVDEVEVEPAGARAVITRLHHVRLPNGIRVGLRTVESLWLAETTDPVDDADVIVEPIGPAAREVVRAHVSGDLL